MQDFSANDRRAPDITASRRLQGVSPRGRAKPTAVRLRRPVLPARMRHRASFETRFLLGKRVSVRVNADVVPAWGRADVFDRNPVSKKKYDFEICKIAYQ